MKRRTHKRTMAELRWIQTCLSLILGLQVTAGPGQVSSLIFRLGGAATLPCGNIRDHQVKCKGTTWSFISGSRAVELFARGQIGERAQDRSDRLSLTENCALVLKKVSRDDVGQYRCRQVDTSGRQQGPESVFHLSAFYMTEEKIGDIVRLYCSVFTNETCLYSVKWLYEGPQSHNIDTRSHDCSASVVFNLSDLHNKSKHKKFFKCEVTHRNSGEVQEFTFSPEASRETDTATAGPGGDGATAGPGEDGATAGPAASCCSALTFIMLLMRVAELLLLTVITVLLIRAAGNQRAPERSPAGRRSGAAATQVHSDEDEDEGPVHYENSVRLH